VSSSVTGFRGFRFRGFDLSFLGGCFICFLLCALAQMLDCERLSGCKKLMDNLAMLGFEPAALR
jgi:hypothetical protein